MSELIFECWDHKYICDLIIEREKYLQLDEKSVFREHNTLWTTAAQQIQEIINKEILDYELKYNTVFKADQSLFSGSGSNFEKQGNFPGDAYNLFD